MGFGGEQLGEMQLILAAEKSDQFDVFAHVAYALSPIKAEPSPTPPSPSPPHRLAD
jgi:type I restriction enzyme R subunit